MTKPVQASAASANRAYRTVTRSIVPSDQLNEMRKPTQESGVRAYRAYRTVTRSIVISDQLKLVPNPTLTRVEKA